MTRPQCLSFSSSAAIYDHDAEAARPDAGLHVKSPQIALVATAASRGGAHMAALRLYQGLHDRGCKVTYVAGTVDADCPQVGRESSALQRLNARCRSRIGRALLHWCNPKAVGPHSIDILPSGNARRLNNAAFDLVHLQFINGEFMSIEEIGRIRKPLVWTLHDMWAICGTEHYTVDPADYLGPAGTPLATWPSWCDKWTWQRKRRAWAGINPVVVTPSRWLGELVARSRLLGHLPLEIIPYGLDLDVFRPAHCHGSLQGTKPRRIAFGATGGSTDPRKGFAYFVEAIQRLVGADPLHEYEVIAFGQNAPLQIGPPLSNLKLHNAGVIRNDQAMADLLRASDVFVAPSRLDNLPNTVLEATACGVPTVAFQIGGMPDMIDHQRTGYLARPYAVSDLAQGIAWVLADEKRRNVLSANARAKALAEFASQRQAERMMSLYERLLSGLG